MVIALQENIFKELNLEFESPHGNYIMQETGYELADFFSNVTSFTFMWGKNNKYVFKKKEGASVVIMKGNFRFDETQLVVRSLNLIYQIFGNVEIESNGINWEPASTSAEVSKDHLEKLVEDPKSR